MRVSDIECSSDEDVQHLREALEGLKTCEKKKKKKKEEKPIIIPEAKKLPNTWEAKNKIIIVGMNKKTDASTDTG